MGREDFCRGILSASLVLASATAVFAGAAVKGITAQECQWPNTAEAWELFDHGLLVESELGTLLAALAEDPPDTAHVQLHFPHVLQCLSPPPSPKSRRDAPTPLRWHIGVRSSADSSHLPPPALHIAVLGKTLSGRAETPAADEFPARRSLHHRRYGTAGTFRDGSRPLRYRLPPQDRAHPQIWGDPAYFQGLHLGYPGAIWSPDALISYRPDEHFALAGVAMRSKGIGTLHLWALRGEQRAVAEETALGGAWENAGNRIAGHIPLGSGPRLHLQHHSTPSQGWRRHLQVWWSGRGSPSPFLQLPVKDSPGQWTARSSLSHPLGSQWKLRQEWHLRSPAPDSVRASALHGVRRQRAGAALEFQLSQGSFHQEPGQVRMVVAAGWKIPKSADSLHSRGVLPPSLRGERRWTLVNGWQRTIKTRHNAASEHFQAGVEVRFEKDKMRLDAYSRWRSGPQRLSGRTQLPLRGGGSPQIHTQLNWEW